MGFGVELELTALPRRLFRAKHDTKYAYYQHGYQTLKSAMEERGLATSMITFTLDGGFVKYPRDYKHWYLTHDKSTDGRDEEKASEFSLETRGI